MKIAIIGGGAAGFFAAINIKRTVHDAEIRIFEGGTKVLAKLAVTGGGRCNVTNSFRDASNLEKIYPRGATLMKRLFNVFDNNDAMRWFEDDGIRLVTQEDQCVFPISQDAMEIVRAFINEAKMLGVRVLTNCKVTDIAEDGEDEYEVSYERGNGAGGNGVEASGKEKFDIVIVTTGGSPKEPGLNFVKGLGLEILQPVPSLFSLNIPDVNLRRLTGSVIENAEVSVSGTKLRSQGPLLITDWGMSGPAILKLSSLGARLLKENDYKVKLAVNWTGGMNSSEIADHLGVLFSNIAAKKQISSVSVFGITSRLWSYLLYRATVPDGTRCHEIGKKALNKLCETLSNDIYLTSGNGKYKKEFVTCGGVALSNVNYATLECRKHGNLYFAGEVLDVDAVTGGFNLQAAWTMGYVVAKSIIEKGSGE